MEELQTKNLPWEGYGYFLEHHILCIRCGRCPPLNHSFDKRFETGNSYILPLSTTLMSGLGRLSQAEEYLAQAQWTVLKTPECSDSIKSRLFRNLGLLYAAQGNYADALAHLADDVGAYPFWPQCKFSYIFL